ncbi:hypothetical protein P9112_014091 [Eukaryota sp. TZLM1-RC]
MTIFENARVLVILFTILADVLVFLWLSFMTPMAVVAPPDATPEMSRRLTKLKTELKRKSFHFVGYLFPTLYYTMVATHLGTKSTCILLVSIATIIIQIAEYDRLRHPHRSVTAFNKPFLRKSEYHQPSALAYTMIGNLLSIILYSIPAAIIGLTNAVVGDLAASIVGVRWGRHRLVNKKSFEGSVACLLVCFLLGLHFLTYFLLFSFSSAVRVAIVSSLATTITELFATEGFLGDNVMIPVVTGFASDIAIKFWIGIKKPNILYYRI